jgi:hypothetical protein
MVNGVISGIRKLASKYDMTTKKVSSAIAAIISSHR